MAACIQSLNLMFEIVQSPRKYEVLIPFKLETHLFKFPDFTHGPRIRGIFSSCLGFAPIGREFRTSYT